MLNKIFNSGNLKETIPEEKKQEKNKALQYC